MAGDRERVFQRIQDNTLVEPIHALSVLGEAAMWSKAALTSMADPDPLTRYETVIKLEEALHHVQQLIPLVPSTLAGSRASDPLQDLIRKKADDLDRQIDALTDTRPEIEELRERTLRYEKLREERADLESRLDKLASAADLEASVVDLRRQVEVLEAKLSPDALMAEDYETRLKTVCETWLGLTQSILDQLGSDVRSVVIWLREVLENTRKMKHELEQAIEKTNDERGKLARYREALGGYHRIDQEIAQIIGDAAGVEGAKEMLDQAENYLRQTDRILDGYLDAKERALVALSKPITVGGGS